MVKFSSFYSAPAMLALQALYSLRQFRSSVHLSIHLPVTRRYCVKTTTRSTVQFALSDREMSNFLDTKKYSRGMTPSPRNLGSY